MTENLHPKADTTSVGTIHHGAPQQMHAEVHHVAEEKQGLPQLDVTTFPSQLFWLGLTFCFLYVLISRSALPKIHDILDKRRGRIERDLTRAEQLSRDAAKAQHAYEEMHRRAKESTAHKLLEATASVRAHQDSELTSADAKVVIMLQKAEAETQKRQRALQAEMLPYAGNVAARVVEELTGKTPDSAMLTSVLAR
jgi:F-type H+-transporting ATPase subunit b